MIRKHTRRAAKAAFAVSLAVAIVIGLAAASRRRRRRDADADDHPRDEELRRGVHPGPALQAGARGEGLQGHLQGEHRVDRDHRHRPDERQDQHVPRVHGRHRPGRLRASRSRRRPRRGRTRSPRSSRRSAASRSSTPTPFSDTDAIAVLKPTASKYKVQIARRPEEDPGPEARGAAEFRTRNTGPRRAEEQLPPDERHVRAARRDQRPTGARLEEGAGRRGLLDRPAARAESKYLVLDRPEAPVRVPERRARRVKKLATALGPTSARP